MPPTLQIAQTKEEALVLPPSLVLPPLPDLPPLSESVAYSKTAAGQTVKKDDDASLYAFGSKM